MKAIKNLIKERFGICYLTRFTDEFQELINKAQNKIKPYSSKETSRWTYYFKVKDEEVSSDFDCCDNEDCIKQSKSEIRKVYGKGTHVEECYYDNDGDHENIELCSQCSKPLNEWLTWCDSELEYIEQCKPWNIQFIKDEGFLIYCIFQSSPTQDNAISEYHKHQKGDILIKALEQREQFFQRIGELANFIINLDLENVKEM